MATFFKTFWQRRKRIIVLFLLIMIPVGILYATTFKYVYPAETAFWATTYYGGAEPNLALDEAYDYTTDIDMETNGYYGMWLFLEYLGSNSTDDIIISYFAGYDTSNFDDTPLWSVTATNDGTDDQISFLVMPAPPHGRIGVKTTGTSTTFGYAITYLPMQGDGT